MPGLALPFLVVGAAAGWISAGFLANPFLGITEGGDQALAAAVAAAVAGLVGYALSRWCDERMAWHPPRITWMRLALNVVAGGAAAGGIVAMIEYATPVAILAGACNGGLSGVAFLPVCALVFAAAKRAERARHGSLVAGSDRRAVWGILATALAAATAVAALDWPFVGGLYFCEVDAPKVALSMLAAAGLVIAGILVADAVALRSVRTAGLEARDHDAAPSADAARRLDLGLGEGLLVALAQAGAAAYRSRERATALVVGDPALARAALRRALARGAVGLGVVALAAGAHVIAVRHARSLYAGDMAMVPSLGRKVARLLAHL
jgi:hypothetical protein